MGGSSSAAPPALRPAPPVSASRLADEHFWAEMTGRRARTRWTAHFRRGRSQTVVPGLSVTLGYEWGGALVPPTRVPGETEPGPAPATLYLPCRSRGFGRSIPAATHAGVSARKVSASLEHREAPRFLESEGQYDGRFLTRDGRRAPGSAPLLEKQRPTDLAKPCTKELEAERAPPGAGGPTSGARAGARLVRRCAYAPYRPSSFEKGARMRTNLNQFTCAAPAMCVDPVNCCAR